MAGEGPKVTICHVPAGNPENAQTLSVGAPAVSAHLDNHPGDHLGECAEASSGSSSSGSSSSGSGNPAAPVPTSYLIFAVRSTGTGGLAETATQIINAELSLLIGTDGNVYGVAVQNWRKER